MFTADCLRPSHLFNAFACVSVGISLLTGPAASQSAQVFADSEKLYACINEAYPEGEPPLRPGQTPPRRPEPGECSGIVANSCKPRHCNERESLAWLHLARQAAKDEGSRVRSGVNGRA